LGPGKPKTGSADTVLLADGTETRDVHMILEKWKQDYECLLSATGENFDKQFLENAERLLDNGSMILGFSRKQLPPVL